MRAGQAGPNDGKADRKIAISDAEQRLENNGQLRRVVIQIGIAVLTFGPFFFLGDGDLGGGLSVHRGTSHA